MGYDRPGDCRYEQALFSMNMPYSAARSLALGESAQNLYYVIRVYDIMGIL